MSSTSASDIKNINVLWWRWFWWISCQSFGEFYYYVLLEINWVLILSLCKWNWRPPNRSNHQRNCRLRPFSVMTVTTKRWNKCRPSVECECETLAETHRRRRDRIRLAKRNRAFAIQRRFSRKICAKASNKISTPRTNTHTHAPHHTHS